MNPDSTGQKQTGRWPPGQSGNPDGRPLGSRNKTTLAVEALLDGEAVEITRRAVEKANEGDPTALRLCLDRIAPARKDRLTPFEMPPIRTATDAIGAMAAIVEGVASGALTPAEAGHLSRLVEAFVSTVEAADHEERLSRIEEQLKRGRS